MYYRDRSKKDLLRPNCKSCESIRNRVSHLKTTYNLSIEDYSALYKAQNGECKICSKHKDVLCVDHCHKTKNNRGLLCDKCNAALGMLDECFERFLYAAAYLKQANNTPTSVLPSYDVLY